MKEIFLKHNYHWYNEDFDTGIERNILDKIVKALAVPHIIAISGARRSGKSYLFRQLIKYLLNSGVHPENILQINFEDPFFISAREDVSVLDTIYSEYLSLKNPDEKIYLFFDEIQNIKNWQLWIRHSYDQKKNIKIFITGSNSELLSTELGTHLTGRILAFENFPFSYSEFFKGISDEPISNFHTAADSKTLFQNIYPYKEKMMHYIELSFKKGLFPEVLYLKNDELIKDILSQYFQNVLFRDIIPRFSIRNTRVIEQLGYYLSTNFTSMYSYRKLANTMNTNENTIKEYLSFFEKAYLFFSIDYFEYSLKKQFKRNKKIFIIDNGIRRATSFAFSEDIGKYAENMIYLQLRRATDKIYYWYEDKTFKEIDFVVKLENKLLAINVTYTDEINPRELESFAAFLKVVDSDRNILITKNTFEFRKINGKLIELIPFWVFIFLELL